MANILIYSNNPRLLAEWMHVLIADHSVSRLLNARSEYRADAVIIDAGKLDEDASLMAVFSNPNVRFLVMGSHWPEQKQVEVMLRGAAGYCEEAEAGQLLKRAVECILRGDIWIRRSLVPKVLGVLTGQMQSSQGNHLSLDERDKLTRMSNSLSARELEVANMIRQGKSNRSIAEAMSISERTVKAHLSSIFRKFEVDDRLCLAIRLKEIDQYR
ncbi:response regulator transcription factor [Methylomonas sp. SURF-2]|uniref:Response regulator transcription factor n=1 Tax=Methylomonas subterranea TaxID=2952225 RepID=A0ABT1TC57_9GAMM|nr:response regulator transcription factor [Methylomonas sp. SURF-2]